MLFVNERVQGEAASVWDEHCQTDYDPAMYAQVPLNEVVFWEGEDGRAAGVEFSAFRVTLVREGGGGGIQGDVEVVGGGGRGMMVMQ